MTFSSRGAATETAPRRRSLRGPALLLAVVAAVLMVALAAQAVMFWTDPSSDAASAIIQASFFVRTVCEVAMAVCVALLVQRAAGPDGGLGRAVLLVLGLFTLLLLFRPWGVVLSTALALAQSSSAPSLDPGSLPAMAGRGLTLLVILAVGLVALLIALRPPQSPRMLRLPGSPAQLAVAFTVLALVAVLSIPVGWIAGTIPAEGYQVATVIFAARSLIGGTAFALLFLVGALLIARSTARPRLLTWCALAAGWVGAIVSGVFFQVLMLQLVLSEGRTWFQLWNLLSSLSELLGSLATLVLAVVVLVLVLRSARTLPPAPPAPSEPPAPSAS